MNFRTLKQLAELAESRELSLGRLMLEEQCLESGEDQDAVFAQMKEYYEIMKKRSIRDCIPIQPPRAG